MSSPTAPLAYRLVRAAKVSGVVTLGFVTVYGTLDLLASQLLSQVKQAVPFVSIGVGIALAILGVTMLRGYAPKLSFLKVGAIDQGKGLRSLYVFGLSYAVVSLSCGFAGFSGVVMSTLRDGSIFGAAATYLTFSAGMGLVLMVLTMAAALAQQTVARSMKRALPYVNRVSGLFLMLAGAYVAYYGYWSYRIQQDNRSSAVRCCGSNGGQHRSARNSSTSPPAPSWRPSSWYSPWSARRLPSAAARPYPT